MKAALVLLVGAALGAGAGAIRPARTTPPVSGGMTNSITSFATDHPEWAVFRDGAREDATPLRLNHAAHLNPDTAGMQDALAPLRAAGAPGVGTAGENRSVLTCGACHQADDSGRYMRPVSFDAHCAPCHSAELGRVNVAPGVVEPEAASHGDVGRLVSLIDRKLLERATLERARPAPAPAAPEGEQGAGSQPAQTPAQPAAPRSGGRKPGGAKPAGGATEPVPAFESAQQATDWLLSERSAALRRFQTGCSKCHSGVTDAPESPKGGAFAIAPPDVPDRWLARSHFAHDAHQMLSCLACHEKAATSERTQDILLPGIATCRECHAPPSARGAVARVSGALGFGRSAGEHSAPGSCVTCHVYHPPVRTGADGGLTIGEFLNVEPAPAAPVVEPKPEPAPPAQPEAPAP